MIKLIMGETDFNAIDAKTINIIKLNNKPKKLLGYKTPNKVFLANFNLDAAIIN